MSRLAKYGEQAQVNIMQEILIPLIRLKFHNFLDSQIQLIQNFNVQVESLLKIEETKWKS